MRTEPINRSHMPLCPFCAALMRAGAPCEVVMFFGLLGLAHTRCVPAAAAATSGGPPKMPAPAAEPIPEPVPVAQPP